MSSDVTAVAPVRPATRSTLVDAAVLMSAAAGVAHVISTPAHWEWWRASGVFFAVVAAAQLGLACALYFNRTGVKTVLAGIATNVVVVSVYVASRLTALPGQPGQTAHHAPRAPGRSFLPAAPEGVGPFDMFALLLEVGLIVVLVSLLAPAVRARVTSALMYCGIGFCALAVWALMSNGRIF